MSKYYTSDEIIDALLVAMAISALAGFIIGLLFGWLVL